MTMPQGPGGLDLQQWLQDNQGNANPPVDPWITPWTNQNNLRGLKNRTEENIRQHYTDAWADLNVTPVDVDLSWWDGLVDAFTAVVGSLPEWLSGLQEVLLWLGDKFDLTFRPVFEWAQTLLTWLKDNVGQALIEGIFNTFKTINNNITLPIFEGLIQALNEFQPLINWLNTNITSTVQGLWATIVSLFSWIDDNIGEPAVKAVLTFVDNLLGAFSGTVNTVLQPALEFLGWLFQNVFGSNVSLAVKDVLVRAWGFLEYLFNTLFPGAISGSIKTLADFLKWLVDAFSGTVETLLKPIFTWLKWLFGVFTPTGLQELFGSFKALITNFGSFSGWVVSLPGVNDILNVVQSLTGSISETLTEAVTGLVSWAQNLPILGPLIGSLMGGWTNPATGTAATLPDLAAWAQNQLTLDTVVPGQNLIGEIPSDLMALLPIGHIGDTQPNLVSDQGFASDAALQSGSGWTWDGSVSAPGVGGGSAKMVGDGSKKQLFSNTIRVSPGQKLTLSAKVKWTKTLGSPAISIGVRGYTGSLVKFTSNVAQITANATASSSSSASTYAVSGAGTTATYADGWVTISGNYTIPQQIVENGAVQAAIDSMRMYVGCANTTAGLTVWFDEAVMKKTSLLPQDLVSELTADLGDKLPGTDFQALLNKIAQQTGASLSDVETALTAYLTGDSELNGSNITSGNITSAFITELTTTWSKIYYGISNGSNAAADEIAALKSKLDIGAITAAQYTAGVSDILNKYPTASLQDFVSSMANQGSLLQSNISKISGLQTATGSLETRMAGVEDFAVKLRDVTKTSVDSILELQRVVTASQKSITELQTWSAKAKIDIDALKLKTSTPVTSNPPTDSSPGTNPTTSPGTSPTGGGTTPAAPKPVSVEDTFDRVATSVGGNWTLAAIRNPDGSTLKTDGNNAVIQPPTFSSAQPEWAAVWSGTGSTSTTKFQRVFATMGSQGGVPLVGPVGYNDLIARAGAGNPLVGVVARFFADGTVRLFARSGAWEDNQYTPSVYPGAGVQATMWTAPFKPITGTTIELLAGVSGDQSQFRAKVGTWLSPIVTMPANVMSLLGNGWGMGFGNGWAGSFIPGTNTPQPAGAYNIWGANDQ